MSVVVKIPTPLRKVVGNQDTLAATGSNLLECIETLEASYPGIKERLCDDAGEVRRFVNIYVNGEDVRFLQGLGTHLNDGDEVSIVPAVAGG
ncbi:MAG: ubiquitin-like small modifier protein 1 [Dehalococcoidia bacterium]